MPELPTQYDARIIGLFQAMVLKEASDLHLVPGYPPTLRVHGHLQPAEHASLDAEAAETMILSILPRKTQDRPAVAKNTDFSLETVCDGALHRFRANVYLAQDRWCACFRHIPRQIPDIAWLGFPAALAQRINNLREGLVIVTGITGSGKSTTLAALVEMFNRQGGHRIITVEEPIEYVYSGTFGSIITQREVGRDVDSFYDGLKFGLRQDPNLILVGEIRDRETAQMALSAAETGHLILATMHTRDAKGAITRLLDLFPRENQEELRSQLALALRVVICQHLLPSLNEGEKRVLALETLIANHPVQSGIRAGKIESLESAIQTGKKDGMETIDENLARLVFAGRISADTARAYAKDPRLLRV